METPSANHCNQPVSNNRKNTNPPRDDDRLWKQVVEGDARAWKSLVERYQALVYAVVTRSGLDYARAADCFQQTWVLLYENRHRIDSPNRVSAWLVTTAKREALRMKRLSARMSPLDDSINPPDQASLQDEELERTQLQFHLEVALGEIDARCRKLLTLMFFESESSSYEEIAEQLGISSNALGPARRRCLDRLKKALVNRGILDARNDR